MKDYYEILEISPRASSEIIKQTYHILIEKYDPQKYQGEQKLACEQRIREITEAYKILSDDFLKEQYDSELQKEKATKVNNTQNDFYQNEHIEVEQRPQKQKNKKEYKVGTMRSMIHLTKNLVDNIPKENFKKGLDKKGVIALIAAILIVLLIGVALWFIPVTNGFMKSFLLIG